MTPISKIFCGITLLTVPSIVYGGYFLLTVISGYALAQLTDFQKSMFRAGHAHAGVLVLLSLTAQMLIDQSGLGVIIALCLRIGFPLSAILVSGGFFAAAIGKDVTRPTSLISILYAGIALLVIVLIVLGIALIVNQ